MSKKNRAQKIAPMAPAVEVVAVETAPVQVAPVEATPVEATPAKSAKVRFVPGRFAPTWVITVLPAGIPNPKRGKSRARFALHETGLTVAQYVQKSVDAGNSASYAHLDLRWDAAHGLIAVEAPAPVVE